MSKQVSKHGAEHPQKSNIDMDNPVKFPYSTCNMGMDNPVIIKYLYCTCNMGMDNHAKYLYCGH